MKKLIDMFAKGISGFAGQVHTEPTRQLISLANKRRTLTAKQLEALRVGRQNRKGVRLSDEIKQKISENRRGKNTGDKHHLWRGGHSRAYKTGYYSAEFRAWRKAVFERDNYTCQDCGVTGAKARLNAHHIKSWAQYPKLRFNINNGKTLCESCHEKTDNFRGRNMFKETYNREGVNI